MSMDTIDGRLITIAGKMRSGKSAYTAKCVEREPRVIAWDPHDQWSRLPGWNRITSIVDLHQVSQTARPIKLAYVMQGDDVKLRFNQFCEVALQMGELFGRCSIIAEELADVSSSGKAPGAWGTLLRKSLKLNLDVYAISQRWAEADKTAINNASEIVCFSMMPMDVSYMATRMGIDQSELAGLKKMIKGGWIHLPYVRLQIEAEVITRDQLKFREKK